MDEATSTGSATPTQRPRRRWARQLAWVVCIALVLSSAVGVVYVRLASNIHRLDISALLGEDRPARAQGPLNVLVMGSDTRTGIGTTKFGTDTVEGGAHSDTNLLVHLSADRQRAVVVSIPRDSMTRAPRDCTDPRSRAQDGPVRQWNRNFTLGGPACTIRTLEAATGVFVDHFVVVDFRGFADMVDALGGVDVCTPVPIRDEDSALDLPAGRHHLDGEQALGYVRVRKTLGDGSDLGRIERQQAFLSSVAQEATSSRLLARPDRLYRFLDAATRSMTTDPGLSVGGMQDIAASLQDLGVENIELVTVPTRPYPRDPNRVEWAPAATGLWAAIREDRELPGTRAPQRSRSTRGEGPSTRGEGSIPRRTAAGSICAG
ncbi:LCP family protein [Janibacter massiliensis]|uniref:LCP family protein n=1 Tax=Janibacter massiliensis TaxID=2058291 RepID=UPI000D0E572B|nr:LCP family protein [Janibacter massiliensis]